MAGQDNLELPTKKMRLNQTYHQINIGIDWVLFILNILFA